uniref:Uncharacterized protein n=1 Tax=Macaca mulatta TaxID=9544 RepID=A0A5F8A365_MACMU
MRSRDRDHTGQHVETPSLLKIQKLAGRGDTYLQSQLLGRLRQENRLNSGGGGCSELRSCHCSPAWVTERNSVSKKKNNSHLLCPGYCCKCFTAKHLIITTALSLDILIIPFVHMGMLTHRNFKESYKLSKFT